MADEANDALAEATDAAEAQGEGGENADTPETEGTQATGRPRQRLNPKKMAAVAASLLLLLAGATYFTWDYLPDLGSGEKTGAQAKVYYNLPEMVVNLNSQDKRAEYLKLKVSLEAPNQKVLDALNPIMPRVLDMFQLYLRELRSSDLEGSAGIYRLKEELLRRINLEIHPHQISRVLFNEIIVQ